MRVLLTCVPGMGHLNPLLPLANALASAGHEVAIATGPELQRRIEAAGFTALCAGLSTEAALQQLPSRFPDRAYERLAPAEIMSWFGPHLFCEIMAPAMLEDLQPLVRTWRPDVIVHETLEIAAPISAACAGVPSISHTLGLRLEGELLELAAAALAPLWRQCGLDPDPTAGVYRHLCADIAPPSLQSGARLSHDIRPLRPIAAAAVDGEQLPAWMTARRPVPLVYMTLGTNTNSDLSMFRSVLDGLADQQVDVLLTIGTQNDPSAIGAVPTNAHLEPYVPQSLLLPECTVVICHAGAGTTLASLAHGLPILALPQGADQYTMSERLVRSGAGLCLEPPQVNPDSVREGVLELLSRTTHRVAARRLQREIADMPAPEEIVPLVEEIAATRSAVLRR